MVAIRLGVATGDAGSVLLRRAVANITPAMTAKSVTARAADGNCGAEVEEVEEVDANTITLPAIHEWRVQWYSYVPGVVKVCVKLAPSFIIPESKEAAPVGTLNEVTVWSVPPLFVSMLVHVTVLFTPITTVTFSGEKPGAAEGPTPAPTGMLTTTTAAGWALATGKVKANPKTTRRVSPPATARIFRETIGRKSRFLAINLSGPPGLFLVEDCLILTERLRYDRLSHSRRATARGGAALRRWRAKKAGAVARRKGRGPSEQELVRDTVSEATGVHFEVVVPHPAFPLAVDRLEWFMRVRNREEIAKAPYLNAVWKEKRVGIWLESLAVGDTIDWIELAYGDEKAGASLDIDYSRFEDRAFQEDFEQRFPIVMARIREYEQVAAEASKKTRVRLQIRRAGSKGMLVFTVAALVQSPKRGTAGSLASALKRSVSALKEVYQRIMELYGLSLPDVANTSEPPRGDSVP